MIRSTRRCAVLVAALLTMLALAFVVPGRSVAAPGPPSAPEYWFDSWQLPQLWADGARGQGIAIAEIDTGVNASLPDLAANVIAGTDLGAGVDGRIDREISRFGHGTAMASIMVAKPGLLGITGIAPDATVLPIALPLIGTTDAAGDDHLAEAITYAADHGAKVISMSLGGVRKPSQTDEPCPTDEQQAIYHALAKGAVLLAAAGNTGQAGNAVEEPGVCLGVLAVGAVDRSGTVASFSARHPYVTLTAPGVDIPSLSRIRGSAYEGRGTSQATAIASAVVALVWSKFPQLTGEQVVSRVLATLDRPRSVPSPAYGYGELNAHRAITQAVPVAAENPVYTAVAPFLARYQALAAPPAATAPPAVTSSPPGVGSLGRFSVGSAPRHRAVQVWWGVGLAVLGLVALLALSVLARARRRRLGASALAAAGPAIATAGPDGAAAAPDGTAAGPEPASAGPDPAGTPSVHAPGDRLDWHDITPPP